MSFDAMNVLKAAGAAAGVGLVGFGAYKAVEHFKGQDNPEAEATTESTDSTDSSEAVESTSAVTSEFQELTAQKLESYPEFVTASFPNLDIREGCVFELNGEDYILIEGTDTKFSDNLRPQAILFQLIDSNYKMISSVTISKDKVSYNQSGSVSIGYLNNGAVQAFKGSGQNETINNFNNDFVIAQ